MAHRPRTRRHPRHAISPAGRDPLGQRGLQGIFPDRKKAYEEMSSTRPDGAGSGRPPSMIDSDSPSPPSTSRATRKPPSSPAPTLHTPKAAEAGKRDFIFNQGGLFLVLVGSINHGGHGAHGEKTQPLVICVLFRVDPSRFRFKLDLGHEPSFRLLTWRGFAHVGHGIIRKQPDGIRTVNGARRRVCRGKALNPPYPGSSLLVMRRPVGLGRPPSILPAYHCSVRFPSVGGSVSRRAREGGRHRCFGQKSGHIGKKGRDGDRGPQLTQHRFAGGIFFFQFIID